MGALCCYLKCTPGYVTPGLTALGPGMQARKPKQGPREAGWRCSAEQASRGGAAGPAGAEEMPHPSARGDREPPGNPKSSRSPVKKLPLWEFKKVPAEGISKSHSQ